MFRVCSAARAAASAAAPSTCSDDEAVTWDDIMDRIAWRTAAVKDSSSAVTGALSLRRSARACAASLRRAAAALARASWVAVSQAQASWMTKRGDPDRSTGPEVRFPAPVIVVLSSPNVVSDALHLVRYASRTLSAGAARWSSRVVMRVQVSETSSRSRQGRTAADQAGEQGLLPGPRLSQDGPEHGTAGAGGQRDDPQLRERRGSLALLRGGAGATEHRPVLRRIRQVHQHPVGGAHHRPGQQHRRRLIIG